MELPEKCPHCGKDWKFSYVADVRDSHGNITCSTYMFFRLLRCDFCGKIIAVYSSEQDNQIHSIFPSKANPKLPLSIKALSPHGYETYVQSLQAKSEGLNQLVGGGIRKALEFIVTDFLIKICKEGANTIKALSLHSRIEKLEKTLTAAACAMFTKEAGNGKTHYADTTEFTEDEMISNIEVLCVFMDAHMKIIEAEAKVAEMRKTRANQQSKT